jgi:O-methyltransferase involved in polyketide biosynthesis
MGQGEPAIRNISDTANWAAVYRARESERPDALFRDPFARRLAGELGERIFETLVERSPGPANEPVQVCMR